MWWPKIIVMCTIYVCIARGREIGRPRPPTNHTANPISIDNICLTWECLMTVSWISENMNSSVDPCDDFYEFTCGRFGKGGLTSPGAHTKNVYNAANEDLDTRLRYIIENIDKEKSVKPFKLVKILYDNCMNSNEDGSVRAIEGFYKKLRDISGWPVLVGKFWRGLALNTNTILTALLKVTLYPDMEDSEKSIPWIEQKHRVLAPEILSMGFTNEIVQAYYKCMVDVAVMFGAERRRAGSELRDAVLVEIMLANDTLPEADRWIGHRAYTRTTVGEFVDKYPKLPIFEFIHSHVPRAYKLTDYDVIMVPKDFDNVEKVLSQTPKRVLANLLWWLRVKSSTAPVGEEIRDRIHEFNSLINRSVRPVDKWKKCVEIVRSKLGLSLSALYQRSYIDQKVVSDTDEMATAMQQAIYAIVGEAEWLDTASKREALEKVENIIGHVSFRNEYKDDKKLEEFYEDLELVEGDLQQSIANISVFWSNYTHRHLRYSLERDHWTMNGNLVSMSGMYTPSFNTYAVPAGFVLPNYYALHRSKFLNYAGLGFVIAHEMSHSLDTNGIFIDKNANLREWWSRKSKQNFDERVKCMIDQYGNYTVDEVGLKLRAYHKSDENIADNLGVKVAYRAYLEWASQNTAEKLLPGLDLYTPQQMFWIGLGNTWCEDYKNLELMYAVLADEHSPVKFRINGALANTPEFSNDFKCKLGSNMNPVKKCSVW